ncbi:CHAT domain-containing protein [Streptomyces collinus]|uniref:CHAT domain-containing protein n=1 Tax=Streptomyces collinus TaxID=42684 RepID=UPI0036B4658E
MNPEQAGIPAHPWQRKIVTAPAGDDLDNTIRALLDLVAQAPIASATRADAVRDLGNAMLTRYLRPSPHGEQYRMDALNTAADLYATAWETAPADDAIRAGYASNHAVALLTRFRALGRETDLAYAEERARTAVGLTPYGHPDRIGRLHTLAIVLSKRAHRLGDAGLLDDAVRQHAEAVTALTPNHPRRVAVVSGFGNSLHQRYHLNSHPADLTQAMTCHEVALAECGNSHPARAACLSNLGDCLLTRFRTIGDADDLTTGIERLEEAAAATAETDPDFPTRLNNLASALRTRYDNQGDPSDLDRAVTLTEKALSVMPSVHSERPTLLGNLGAALHTRYKHRGIEHDLADAEKALREALEALPTTSLDRPRWLNNLGNALLSRFERCGTPAVIDEAVACATQAVEQTAPQDPARSTRLHGLASALRARYDRCHRLTDLDQAIEGEQAAVAAAASGTRAHAVALGGLGTALRDRFSVRGVLADLTTAIDAMRQAVPLVSVRDPDRPTWLSQLGGALAERHNIGTGIGDADEAVTALIDAVKATDPGHPHYVRRMLSLAEALRLRHAGPATLEAADNARQRSDLDHAVGCCRAAVRSARDGHPDRPAALHQLGGTLLTRYRRDHRAVDLWRALRAQHWALALTPADHPDRALMQRALAYGVRLRYQRTGRLDDARTAVCLAREAAEVRGPDTESASPASLAELSRCLRSLAVALDASSPGGRLADEYRADARAQGRLALDLHVRNAPAQSPQSALATARGARLHTAEVARWCLADQRPDEAVEVLEQGRGLVVHAAMLSGSVGDRLRKANRPELAEDWEAARAEAHRNRRRTVPEELRHQVITALTADSKQPQLPGPPTLHEIQHALNTTGNDALVYVMTGTPHTAGYALLVPRTGRPMELKLPGLRAVPGNPLAQYVDAYNHHLRASDARASAEASETGTALRKARQESHTAWSTWTQTLNRLCDWAWETLVGRLLEAFPASAGCAKPRLVLVPSGHAGLVPWHAARRPGATRLPRYAVHEATFSYAASARAFHAVSERELAAYDSRALLVGNPTHDLKYADDEADSLRAYYPLAERLGASAAQGTAPAVPGRVLAALPGLEGDGLPMVHLACHATFDRDPITSRLLLANGQNLTVSRLLAHSGRRITTVGPLVVLSACTSALTADNFDEALTLSTAFLTAGAAATVGSLWTVNDMRTPLLMEDFHRLMPQGGLAPAEALGEAQARQAESSESGSPYYWAAFSHHGR